MGLTITTTIKNSHLPETARRLIANELQKHNGQVLRIEIKRNTQKTLKQYGYLFGVVYPIIANAIKELDGQVVSIDEVDLMMKSKFWNTLLIDPDNNEILRLPNLKRKMNKAELVVFIDDVINWGTLTLGIEKFPTKEDLDENDVFHIENISPY